jgi:hypothetical protein
MEYGPLSVVLGGFANQAVQAANSCSRRLVTVTGDFPIWGTNNNSIATASGIQINGVDAGTMNHNAQRIKSDASSCEPSH